MRVFVLITVTALTVGNAGSAEGTISFNREVRPILSDHCFPCHGPDEQTREANLRLDESASAADVLQNRLDGEFWRRVTLDAGDDDLKSICYSNLGVTYRKTGDLAKAMTS